MTQSAPKTIELIPSRERDLGDGFKVRRLLPHVSRKTVGPFIFLDQMGPAVFPPGQGLDVRPHPHINLATVTYLFEGEILHRDSVGSEQVIRPGDINWMTAGRGIVHSERTPAERRRTGGRLDGIQCWVALPRAYEETEPTFAHHPGSTLPKLDVGGVTVKVLVGSALGARSPVHSFSDTVYLDVALPAGARLELPAVGRELAVYAPTGAVRVCGQDVPEKALAVGRPGQDLSIEALAAARVLVLGGERFPESREIWWNFVSTSKARIEQAKAAWARGEFPKVPGDEVEFIPLPGEPASRQPPGTIM